MACEAPDEDSLEPDLNPKRGLRGRSVKGGGGRLDPPGPLDPPHFKGALTPAPPARVGVVPPQGSSVRVLRTVPGSRTAVCRACATAPVTHGRCVGPGGPVAPHRAFGAGPTGRRLGHTGLATHGPWGGGEAMPWPWGAWGGGGRAVVGDAVPCPSRSCPGRRLFVIGANDVGQIGLAQNFTAVPQPLISPNEKTVNRIAAGGQGSVFVAGVATALQAQSPGTGGRLRSQEAMETGVPWRLERRHATSVRQANWCSLGTGPISKAAQ